MKKCLFILILFVASNVQGQNWEDTVKLIRNAFERYKTDRPGGQLAISRHGKLIFSAVWGMADMERSVPMTGESVMEAGSVSKQFTAAAILLLEQQGKLSLDDRLQKHIPEVPDYGASITLRHLMQHTSGIKDWGTIAAIAGWPRGTKTYSNDDALLIISRQKTLNNRPGAEYIYSNSNYNLLAMVVQRVSGMSLADFSGVYIFQPAGMKHTQWRDDFKRIVPGRALAYGKNGEAYYTEMPNEYVYGNGGLLTTAEDLIAWNHYYLGGKFGSPSLLPKQLESSPFNNGKPNVYGAGLVVDSLKGWKVIFHDGATAAYRANLEYYPDLGLSIAWLSNTSEFDRSPAAVSLVRNLLVKDVTNKTELIQMAAFEVGKEKLESHTGWYKNTRTSAGVRIVSRKGTLELVRANPVRLFALSDNVFYSGNNRMEFRPGAQRSMLYITPVDTILFTGVDSAQLDDKALREYTGDYYSTEADAGFSVRIKDGKLIAHQDPKTDIPLEPGYRDGFSTYTGEIYFERDKRNRVTTMRIYSGRARNVEFKKVAR